MCIGGSATVSAGAISRVGVIFYWGVPDPIIHKGIFYSVAACSSPLGALPWSTASLLLGGWKRGAPRQYGAGQQGFW
jgi:hypothetical protein